MLNLSHFNSVSLKGDVFGALTSTIVALPFALAFGITSGAGATAGLYCAIITGFFASLFGGTNQQISGPNTGLTVAMAAIIASFMAQSPESGLAAAFTCVSLAGLLQILFGSLKLGKYFVLVSYPVISGFTSGIGILIILSQLDLFLGYPVSQVPQQLAAGELFNSNLLLALSALILLFIWPQGLNNKLPASVLVLLIGVVFLWVNGGDLKVVEAIPSALPEFQWPVWDADLLGEMFKSALLLAILSTLDSLMTSLTVDSMSDELHDSDQELIGQGVGNTLAGLFGALPGGGATMRTVTNLRAGGKTPISGMLHAVFILVIVLWAGDYTAYIPVAVLSAILLKVGLSIIDWNFLRRLFQLPVFSAGLMLSVMLMSVIFDLVTAVLVGVFVANMVTIRRLSEIQLDNLTLWSQQHTKALPEPDLALYQKLSDKLNILHISGPISFGVARGLKQRMSQSQDNKALLIDLQDARFVGITSTIAIEEIILSYLQQDKAVYLSGVCDRVKKDFDKLKLMQKLPTNNVFSNRQAALVQIGE